MGPLELENSLVSESLFSNVGAPFPACSSLFFGDWVEICSGMRCEVEGSLGYIPLTPNGPLNGKAAIDVVTTTFLIPALYPCSKMFKEPCTAVW